MPGLGTIINILFIIIGGVCGPFHPVCQSGTGLDHHYGHVGFPWKGLHLFCNSRRAVPGNGNPACRPDQSVYYGPRNGQPLLCGIGPDFLRGSQPVLGQENPCGKSPAGTGCCGGMVSVCVESRDRHKGIHSCRTGGNYDRQGKWNRPIL